MTQRRAVVVNIVGAVMATYALALMYQMTNEFFDRSSPQVERVTVVEHKTRYNPIPIRVLTVKAHGGTAFELDVLDELAANARIGTELNVVRQSGLFGKQWVQDQEFHTDLSGTRTIQGFIYLAFGCVVATLWFFIARRRLHSSAKAGGSLLAAMLLAFGIFWVLP